MRLGTVSALGLGASGVAIALMPERTAAAMQLKPLSNRGITETRVGLGATYAALGMWAAARGTSDAYTAVGATWLGAAAVRGWSLRKDEPQTDPSFWAYLTMESVLGIAGVLARGRRT